MKVLYIIDSLGLGGAQSVVKGIFKEQKNNKGIFLFALRERNIKMEINHPNVFIYPSKRKYSFNPMKSLKNLIEKERIDVLHCHLFRSEVTGYLLKKRYFPNIKLIFHEHGEIFQEHTLYNFFMKTAKKRINKFIAVSKATKKELIKKAKITPEKIVVLYNFVDTEKFNRKNIIWDIKKEKEKLGIEKDEYVIGFVGRLAYVKGCDVLIKALPNLDFKYKVLIAGNGPEKEKLERLAERLGVRDKVIFLGYIDNPLWAYSLMDVLVVPSRSEACPMSLFEAKSLEIPLILSNINNLKEYLENGKSGYFFNNLELNDFRKKLGMIKGKKLQWEDLKILNLRNYIQRLSEIYNETN